MSSAEPFADFMEALFPTTPEVAEFKRKIEAKIEVAEAKLREVENGRLRSMIREQIIDFARAMFEASGDHRTLRATFGALRLGGWDIPHQVWAGECAHCGRARHDGTACR